MAISILALNGIGLGHLSRMSLLADALYRKGERPVLFYQSAHPPPGDTPFYKVKIENLSKSDIAYIGRVVDKINTSCIVTSPHIFIEDTHAARFQLRDSISRILVIRPTSFEYLCWVREKYGETFEAFVIADHPDSPTWPYSAEETIELSTWHKFAIIGPIFRVAVPDNIATIKDRYGWDAASPLFVVTMGGGGQQPGSNDAEVFVEKATDICVRMRDLNPFSRFFFVKGPLFDRRISIPALFEAVEEEKDMPSLLSIAEAAVIRPGFNTIWECIQAETPFYCIGGTTFSEPVNQKLRRLADHGLADNDGFFDPVIRQRFKTRCKAIMAQWNGAPDEAFLSWLTEAGRSKLTVEESESDAMEWEGPVWDRLGSPGIPATGKKFFIRLDDVVSLTPEVRFVLDLAKEYGIFISLEVIPYLSRLREEELNEYGVDDLIVSQHGYSHILNLANPEEVRSEFVLSENIDQEKVVELVRGKDYMRLNFKDRFHNGFSAPFDSLPAWLPGVLFTEGWHYLVVNSRKKYEGLNVVRACVDVWDWPGGHIKDAGRLVEGIAGQVTIDHYFGLILHARHFTVESNRAILRTIFRELSLTGFSSFRFIDFIE